MIISKVVALVVPAMKRVPRPLAPFPVTREFWLLVGRCMALAVVPFKIGLPAKAPRALFLQTDIHAIVCLGAWTL